MSGKPEPKLITLRCPNCTGPVSVTFRQQEAKCSCGYVWKWKRGPKNFAFVEDRPVLGPYVMTKGRTIPNEPVSGPYPRGRT